MALANLDGSAYRASRAGLWTRGLLIRRTIADQDLAFFSTCAPAGTSIEKLVRVEGCRWAIEDSFETAKNELGLDHNESRSWHGWRRHVSLVMLAFARMLGVAMGLLWAKRGLVLEPWSGRGFDFVQGHHKAFDQ